MEISEIQDLLRKGSGLLDVRTQQEYDSGHVPNSLHIPVDDVAKRMDEVRTLKTPIICYCRSGARSDYTMKALNREGIDCVNAGSWADVKKALDEL